MGVGWLMGRWRLFAILICGVALNEAVAQFCPARNSIVHVGILVVQPTRLPPPLEKYEGISFLPIAFGTGFNVSEDGHVVTTLHVIRRAEKLATEIPPTVKKLVVCANRPAELYDCDEARVIGVDQHHDLALLKTKGARRTATVSVMQLSPAKPLEGTLVWAAGYPGDKKGLLVVAVGRFLGTGQTDAAVATGRSTAPDERFWFAKLAVENGDSGGPVYVQNGSVIGVVVNRSKKDAIAGFVPAQHVIDLMARSGIRNGTTVE